MRLREFKERQRLDENPLAILLPIFTIIGGGGAMLSQPKIEKWVKDNPGEANKFSKEVKKVLPNPENPQSITNPIGNAIVQSWNWLTGGSTQKDNIKKPYVPQPENYTTNKDGLLVNKNKKNIAPKVQYDQYVSQYNTNKDGKPRGKIPPQLIGNIRSQGDAGAGWAKQYDDFNKKRSQINKQIAADIKNGLTKQQLDQKYGDNLQNLNRNLNDHLGKVDNFGKGLKPLVNRDVKTITTKPLVQNIDKDTVKINGKTYDKDFDKAIIDKLIKDQQRKQQGQLSVGADGTGAVSGQGKKVDGTPGAVIGGGGMDIGIKGSGAVSGGKSQEGPLSGQEIGIKGTVVKPEVIPGTNTGTKGEVIPGTNIGTGTVAKPIVGNPALPIARTGIMPPGTMPPPGAQLPKVPLAKQTRKFDPKKDTDIIYKGKVAPDAVSKFKATKSNPQKNKDYYDKLIKKFS